MTTMIRPVPSIATKLSRLATLSLLSGLLDIVFVVSAIGVTIVVGLCAWITYMGAPAPTWVSVLVYVWLFLLLGSVVLPPVAVISGLRALGRVSWQLETRSGPVALVGTLLGGFEIITFVVLACWLTAGGVQPVR